LIQRTDHLYDVAYRIRQAGVELCDKNVRYVNGLLVHDAKLYGKEYEQAARNALGIGDATVISYIQPGFPASLAGLSVGDTVLSINSKPVKNATESMKKLLELTATNSPSVLEFTHAGQKNTISLTPVPVISYPTLLAADDVVNAYADGNSVFVAQGMMRFVETDEELALVLGHEFSHNCLGHIGKKKGNWLLGSILDVAVAVGTGVNTGGMFGDAAASAFSQEFETEADYMGMYLAALAGYDVDHAAEFWRRMAVEHPGSIKKNFSASHPSSPERFIRLDETAKEIAAKRASGVPLVPDKK
jgi:membrane-associated protease RseP (regulator of RpoE activity)